MKSPGQESVRFQGNFATLVGSVPAWKRVLDVVLILAALPLVIPLSLLVALAIKLVSRGPVLFQQTRVGYLGQNFEIYKFRTMAVNADSAEHKAHLNNLMCSDRPMTKLDPADPRLIPFGSLLRTTGIDELPQLLNIIRGEMSLVGPRPCLPYECEKYHPRHFRRFETLPGLTGWWQVNGKNRTTFERMMDLDIQYVEAKSAWMDLKIILRTIPAILMQVSDSHKTHQQVRLGVAPGVAVEDRSVEQTF